eukprot:CAMPEP_0184351130 /NCGR_PEP_ID=MMETSP1089-20130417/43417_1 /TAXON_ID=38269 ORGANISM="Gloeochaete wittrockiana, Strain SAG46.84" /NCGR_SAMPLE_ID=MMETSP1089 /ASSEMBLY_ACC=CAM_ASM_000445 /LENGTH=831 /DNA_ID=CAMNT_0026684379 /DNA_START=20 /DNA_END=2515 /DNA_ORIENTATION=+
MPFAQKAARNDVRQLTDIHEIISLLSEVTKRERGQDAELEHLFDERPTLEAKLNTLQNLKPVLDKVKREADGLVARLKETSTLAENVSSKVRELDTAQSRVADTLKRIDMLLHLKEGGDKVQSAMQREDWEEAGRHVEWFLEEEAALPDDASKADMKAKVKGVQEKILLKFRSAARARNHQAVVTFAKLLTAVGLREEGLVDFSKYVQDVVRTDSEKKIDEANSISPPPYLDLTRSLLEGFAEVIQECTALAEECFGEYTGLRILEQTFKQGDEHVTSVLRRYVDYRNIPSRLKDLLMNRGTTVDRDNRELDVLLTEMAQLSSQCEQYLRFVRNTASEAMVVHSSPIATSPRGSVTARSVVGGTTSTASQQPAHPPQIHGQSLTQNQSALSVGQSNLLTVRSGAPSFDINAVIKQSTMYRVLGEMMNNYVGMEQAFMVDNVSKAMRIEEVTAGGLTSSIVDDVFYSVHTSISRALSTLNTNALYATLNNVNTLLNKDYKEALRKRLKEADTTTVTAAVGSAATKVVAAAADKLKDYNPLSSKIFPGQAANALAQARITYTTVINNIAVSGEYVEKLRKELEPQMEILLGTGNASGETHGHAPTPHGHGQGQGQGPNHGHAVPQSEKNKATAALDDLKTTANTFSRLAQEGMAELCNTVSARMRQQLDPVEMVSYRLDDAQYADNEINDPWVNSFIAGLDNVLKPYQSSLTPGNYDELLQMVMQNLAKQLENLIIQKNKRFNQLGGLQLDRELRALLTYFSDMTQRTVRDKFARLTQIASILNLEKVTDLLEFWGDNSGPVAWRLSAADVRKVLALRVDFSQRAIEQLKLKG